MSSINWRFIMDALKQLESEDLQRREWLPDESESSFIEATCMLLDDSGLSDALEAKSTGLSQEAEALLLEIEILLVGMNEYRPEPEIIADPTMTKVRTLAAKALKLIEAQAPVIER